MIIYFYNQIFKDVVYYKQPNVMFALLKTETVQNEIS